MHFRAPDSSDRAVAGGENPVQCSSLMSPSTEPRSSRFMVGFALLVLSIVFTAFAWSGLSLRGVLGLLRGYLP